MIYSPLILLNLIIRAITFTFFYHVYIVFCHDIFFNFFLIQQIYWSIFHRKGIYFNRDLGCINVYFPGPGDFIIARNMFLGINLYLSLYPPPFFLTWTCIFLLIWTVESITKSLSPSFLWIISTWGFNIPPVKIILGNTPWFFVFSY